jgi:hypothetical protein
MQVDTSGTPQPRPGTDADLNALHWLDGIVGTPLLMVMLLVALLALVLALVYIAKFRRRLPGPPQPSPAGYGPHGYALPVSQQSYGPPVGQQGYPLVACAACGTPISPAATQCPRCGHPNRPAPR